LVLALAAAAPARGQSVPVSAATAPPVEAAAWIEGRWIGEGFGGVVEEVWSAPRGGQMVGHFRMVRGDAPVFYELLLIDRQVEGLRMRVKHFNPDFTGWEERDRWQAFPPVSAAPNDLRFDGLSMRLDNGEMVITVRIDENGAVRDETLRLRRAPL
jgi:hypothetical protein